MVTLVLVTLATISEGFPLTYILHKGQEVKEVNLRNGTHMAKIPDRGFNSLIYSK